MHLQEPQTIQPKIKGQQTVTYINVIQWWYILLKRFEKKGQREVLEEDNKMNYTKEITSILIHKVVKLFKMLYICMYAALYLHRSLYGKLMLIYIYNVKYILTFCGIRLFVCVSGKSNCIMCIALRFSFMGLVYIDRKLFCNWKRLQNPKQMG